jgi:hypothetical protein
MFDDRPSAWVPKRLGFDGVVANIMGGLYEPACSAVIPFFIPSFIRRTSPTDSPAEEAHRLAALHESVLPARDALERAEDLKT